MDTLNLTNKFIDNPTLSNLVEFNYQTDPHASDTDGDGQSDYQEIVITGMNPTNSTSVFAVDMLTVTPTEEVLSWISVSGRVYDVWQSVDLVGGFAPVQSNLAAGDGGYVEYTNSSPASPIFYRIHVRNP